MAPPTPTHNNPLARLVNLRPGEGAKAAWAVAFFFFVLFGYYLVRPVREALGVERGMDELRWLFVGTLTITFLANPVYAWVVGRWDRRVSLPIVFNFFVVNLLLFAGLLAFFPDVVGVATGRTFFIWLSVFNMFCVTMFWALMADGFRLEQAKRLFPLIAVGGTAGAAAGAGVATALVELIGHTGLMLAAAVCIELGVLACWGLTRCFDREATILAYLEQTGQLPAGTACVHCHHDLGGLHADVDCPACAMPIGAELVGYARDHSARAPDAPHTGVLSGVTAVVRSPYLRGVCGYILIMTVIATFMYFAQARIVMRVAEDTVDRTRLFGIIDLATQVTTLVLQLALTSRLIARIGVGWTLAILPIITTVGFLALGASEWFGLSAMQAFVTIAVLQAVFRSGKYAIARPARETLFTVVPRDAKYKAKGFIDTFVYRGGDAVGAGADWCLTSLVAALPGLFSSVLVALAVTIAPIAIVWAGLGLFLGARQQQLAAEADSSDSSASHPPQLTGAPTS